MKKVYVMGAGTGLNGFEKAKYTTCLLLTQQFRFCGNSFRADTYKGCDFGCKYCFANNRSNFKDRRITPADLSVFEKYINGEGSGMTQELINNRVPVHLGGMSDPFQNAEKKHKTTLEFLKLFKNYPVSISTKTAHLDYEYWDVLDPKFHAFQISLISDNEETIKKFEKNTPSAKDRIKFIKELKSRGFWVSVRIQPIVNIDESISLLKKLNGFIDYATIEHLKVSKTDSGKLRKELFSLIGLESARYVLRRNYYKYPTDIIKSNIKAIKDSTTIKIGCGDNEAHEMSDSLNCCGLDCMPDSFKNWLKYNSMYIQMTGDKEQFYPKSKIYNSNIPNNTYIRFNKNTSYKFYVDKYCEEVHKLDERNLFT